MGVKANIMRTVQIGVAAGPGFLRSPGSPDLRVLTRLAYAPLPDPDSDGDGIRNNEDACPNVRGVESPDPSKNGCPSDQDSDGVIDMDDQCPEQPQGSNPDPRRMGCPMGDSDNDGVLD